MNFLDINGLNLEEEYSQTIIESGTIRIERIVSNKHASPPGFEYDQKKNEWVLLLDGEAELTIAGKPVRLTKGDFVNLPAHVKHRVEWTAENTVWMAIHY